MFPNIPNVESFNNFEEAFALSKQFNAIPVFAGIILKCDSANEYDIPICGGQ